MHRRPDALHSADVVQLQHFDMLLNDTRAFVNKVAGCGGYGLPGIWQGAFSPHDVHRNGSQGSTIIIYSSSGHSGVFIVIPGNQT